MSRLTDWFRLHPWVATAFFVGAIFGVALCLPFVPYTLPDSHASLIGAALGAFVAVWGAAWIGDTKSRRNAATARSTINAEVEPLIEVLEEFNTAVELAKASGDHLQLDIARIKLQSIPKAFDGFSDWLRAAEPLFQEVGAAGMVSFAAAKQATGLVFQLLEGDIDESFVLENSALLKHHCGTLKMALRQLYA